MKLLKAKETVLQKDYGLDKVHNIFNEIYDKCNRLNEYQSIASNEITVKLMPRRKNKKSKS